MSAVNGVFRVSFLKSVFIWICLGAQALAGHDIMVHLAIYNDGPFNVEKVPAVFGVPLPSSDDPIDLKDLILVGADAFQIRPTSHWPNGSIRWLMVEAIVNVQPSADRAVVHLTKGQRPRELPNIASETDDGFLLETGKCTVRIVEGENVLCKVEKIEGESIPEFSIQLSSANEKLGTLLSKKIVLENNGPVAATVAAIEEYEIVGVPFSLSRRCRIFKGQSGFSIESTMRQLPASRFYFFNFNPTLTKLSDLKIQNDQSWQIAYQADGFTQGITSYSFRDHAVQISTVQATHQDDDEIMKTRNLMRRVWEIVDLTPRVNKTGILMPHIGVAISNNTYNDSHCLDAYVIEGTGAGAVTVDNQIVSEEQASDYIYDILGGKLLPKPSVTAAMNKWISRLASSSNHNSSPEDQYMMDTFRFRAAGLLSTWYFLTGDVVLSHLRLDWASLGSLVYIPLARTSFEQWEAYLLDGSINRKNNILSNLGNWIDDAIHIKRGSIIVGLATFRLVSNVIHQGGLEGAELGVWLDRMESLVFKNRNEKPNDILYAEGYRLTGELTFLKEGREWLNQNHSKVPENNAITGMIENIQRQYTWRWLTVTVEDHPEQGKMLKWKVPKNVVRYRLKRADKPITNIPTAKPTGKSVAFCDADEFELEIPLLASGTEQTIHVFKDPSAGSNFIAMRYLERGPDLPSPPVTQSDALKSELAEDLKKKTDNVSTSIWFFLILIVGGLIFILKKKRT